MVLDAGGGTLDVDSYEVMNANPVELREIVRPDCTQILLRLLLVYDSSTAIGRFAGSVFVNMAAREIIEGKGHCFLTMLYTLHTNWNQNIIQGGFEVPDSTMKRY